MRNRVLIAIAAVTTLYALVWCVGLAVRATLFPIETAMYAERKEVYEGLAALEARTK